MYYIGMDLHKQDLVMAVEDEQGPVGRVRRIACRDIEAIQAGGAAVGVQRRTLMPARPSFSTMRWSQSKSNRPSAGSIATQANSAIRTQLMPARFIRRTSSSHRSSGQNSG